MSQATLNQPGGKKSAPEGSGVMDGQSPNRSNAPEKVPVHHYVYAITAVLTVLSFLGAGVSLAWPKATPFAAGLGIATAAHVAGFLLALILFVNVDASLRGMRTAVVGALSGTGLVKAEKIAGYVSLQFAALGSADTRATAGLFFLGVGAGLLGIVGGFAAIRLGFETEIANLGLPLARVRDATVQHAPGSLPAGGDTPEVANGEAKASQEPRPHAREAKADGPRPASTSRSI
jgi:hypothetical protein